LLSETTFCNIFYIFFFLKITAHAQGGNYFSPGGSQGLADNYRRQELIDGHPSQTASHQRKYLQYF
jgi:hypothetical protein